MASDLPETGPVTPAADLLALEGEAMAGRLAAGLAHDLGHLLATVGLNLEVIARRSTNEPIRARAAALRDNVADAVVLVRQLGEVARPGGTGGEAAGPRTTGAPATPVDEVVDGLATFLRPALDRVELRLELGCPGLAAAVPAAELRRCLLNLALNAVAAIDAGSSPAASAAGPQVTLTTTAVDLSGEEDNVWPTGRRGRFVAVDVADTGPGLDPALLARIAESAPRPGAPGEAAPGPSGGSGLGLATTLAVVSACAGALSLANRAGGGSVVGLRLPLAPPPAEVLGENRV
ncbi:MAG: hypothetical protein GEV08_12405 [Acidimicrobiia bacterium]|nr:hypothetical protein [Acidimicrobiia bacterium]